MQRGLSVEHDHIAVFKTPFNDITVFYVNMSFFPCFYRFNADAVSDEAVSIFQAV